MHAVLNEHEIHKCKTADVRLSDKVQSVFTILLTIPLFKQVNCEQKTSGVGGRAGQ